MISQSINVHEFVNDEYVILKPIVHAYGRFKCSDLISIAHHEKSY